MRRLHLAAAAVLLLAAGAQAKQTEPSSAAKPASTISGVTVTAPGKPNPLVDPTTQFVRQHLPENAYTEQYPRFRDDICVKVQGLPAEFDAFVAKRIVEVTAQVGASLDKAANCQPNVDVIFSAQPQKQLADIAKRKDILIGFHYVAQTRKVTTFDRPIRAWYVTRTRDDNGASWLEVASSCPANIPGQPPHGPCGDRPRGRAGSRLSNGMSAEIVHSLIIADANKVARKKIDAIADYVAVLALARWTNIGRCNRIPTVLNLMADDCLGAPEAATPQDLALLKSLYAVDPLETGDMQRAAIASAVRTAGKDPASAH